MALTTTLTALAPVATREVIIDVAFAEYAGSVFEGSKVRPDGTVVYLLDEVVIFADSHMARIHTYADDRLAEVVFDLA